MDDGKQKRRSNKLNQQNLDYEVKVDTVWWKRRDEIHYKLEITSIITIDTGCASLHIDISPAEARALAASLLQHADEVENARYQLAVEAVPA